MQQPQPQPAPAKPFNRNWYFLVFLGPLGMLITVILMAFKDPNPTMRLVGKVIFYGLLILWVIGIAIYGVRAITG